MSTFFFGVSEDRSSIRGVRGGLATICSVVKAHPAL
jgi:hypothetical protein